MAKYKPQIRQDETTVVDLDLCAKYDGEGNDIVETYAKKGESSGASIPFIELNSYATSGVLTQTQYNELVNANIAIILWSSHYFFKEDSGVSMTFSCVTRVNSKFMKYEYISVNNTRAWNTSSILFPTSTGCILYMKNSDSSQGSTSPHYGNVIIGSGLKLNDGILSLAVSSSGSSGGGLYRHYVTGGYTTPKPDKDHYKFEFTINNSNSTALTVSDFTSTTMVSGYSWTSTTTSRVDAVIMSVSPTSTTGYLGIKTYDPINGYVYTYPSVQITDWVDTVTEI